MVVRSRFLAMLLSPAVAQACIVSSSPLAMEDVRSFKADINYALREDREGRPLAVRPRVLDIAFLDPCFCGFVTSMRLNVGFGMAALYEGAQGAVCSTCYRIIR